MNMQIGTISNWNEEKGFGFITPKAGGKDIFLHINDYSRIYKKPFKGLEVKYILDNDAKGRKCATEVFPLRGHKNNGREIRQKIFSILLFISFWCAIYFLYSYKYIPVIIIGLYAILSILAFLLYAKDKNAAEWGAWRTQESTLHTIALLGGWPGAAIAQSFLRHKSKKLSFRITYWITVCINSAVLYSLTTPKGNFWLKNIMRKINLG
jgi:uncharacterized membrane protein YsdA (DUF1294 family)/cold shock CspA family protein